MIVLLDQQRYTAHPHWVDAAYSAGVTSVAVLSDGRVVILLRGQPAKIRVFNTQAELVDEWTLTGLLTVHKLTALPDGGVLVCDVDGHQLHALDAQGKLQWQLGKPDNPQWQAPFNHPTHAVSTPDGRLFITDGYGNSCIHEFNAEREWVRTFGSAGQSITDGATFSVPHSIVHDGTHLYVADRENSRVVVLDEQGTVQRLITPVYKPMSVALHPTGNLLVSDQTASLSMFTPQGDLLGRCRITSVYGHSISCNQDGHIFIAEMLPDRITCLIPLD